MTVRARNTLFKALGVSALAGLIYFLWPSATTQLSQTSQKHVDNSASKGSLAEQPVEADRLLASETTGYGRPVDEGQLNSSDLGESATGDSTVEQTRATELMVRREKNMATAPLRDRARFSDFAQDEFDRGLEDAEAIANNQAILESLFFDQMKVNQRDFEINCSKTICFVDFFGPPGGVPELATAIADRWPADSGFLQAVVHIRNGPDNFRFYFATSDFPADRI